MMNRPTMSTQVHRLSVNKLADAARTGWELPPYQRPLVWKPEQSLRLVESVYEGYPIGAFLVWERSWSEGKKDILLDGQQRLAALTGLRCGTDTLGPLVGWSVVGGCWAIEPVTPDDQLLTLHWYQGADGMDRLNTLIGLKEQYSEQHYVDAVEALDRVTWAIAPVHALERATPHQAAEAFRRLNTEGTPIDLNELERLLRGLV